MAQTPSPDKQHNLPEYSVSEISQALKKTVEQSFSRVRLRGEISGLKRAASGHLYLALKDENAVMEAVCWKGVANRLSMRPEDGLEVICTGRLTTYPGRSKYQIVIEQMEHAGEGALLKLLEDRRKKLAAEGLFDAARKRPVPFLPSVIGVVTSPTGSVIRDIIHRIRDRYPRHILVWPTPVQGDGAAEKIAAGIEGFNAIPENGDIPRPDVIIVARGGGSLEDLWPFSEECVVRATATSNIPVISGVGHETDTMLIDLAADLRAPTPTGAAEKAVPVRLELAAFIERLTGRLKDSGLRLLNDNNTKLESLARGLPDLARLTEDLTQKLDDRTERLALAANTLSQRKLAETHNLSARLRSPQHQLEMAKEKLSALSVQTTRTVTTQLTEAKHKLDQHAGRLTPRTLVAEIGHNQARIIELDNRRKNSFDQLQRQYHEKLDTLSNSLEASSFNSVLKRGFALVRDETGATVTSANTIQNGQYLSLQFKDGEIAATAGQNAQPPAIQTKKKPSKTKKKARKKPVSQTQQASLFDNL